MARTFRRNKKYLILKVVGTIEQVYDDRAWLQWRYPDLSLRDLGEMADPPLSKSALYHRVLRLEKLIEANR